MLVVMCPSCIQILKEKRGLILNVLIVKNHWLWFIFVLMLNNYLRSLFDTECHASDKYHPT